MNKEYERKYDMPNRKDFPDGKKIAYIMSLMGGRGRINITTIDQLDFVEEGY